MRAVLGDVCNRCMAHDGSLAQMQDLRRAGGIVSSVRPHRLAVKFLIIQAARGQWHLSVCSSHRQAALCAIFECCTEPAVLLYATAPCRVAPPRGASSHVRVCYVIMCCVRARVCACAPYAFALRACVSCVFVCINTNV